MNRHALDPVSLISGLVFAAVAALYLAEQHTSLDVDGRWVLPLALICLGVGGIVGALFRAKLQREPAGSETSKSPVASERTTGESVGEPAGQLASGEGTQAD